MKMMIPIAMLVLAGGVPLATLAASPEGCAYDVAGVSKSGTNGLTLTCRQWIKPGISNVTALAAGRGDCLWVGARGWIERIARDGLSRTRFPVAGTVRALAENRDGDLVVGLDDHVEIVGSDGAHKASWNSPQPEAMITSVAVSSNEVLVADCQHRVVWRYAPTGELRGRIGSRDARTHPHGFVVPSAFFDVAVAADGSLWIANPGLHQVEHFTPDGMFLASWGRAGMEDAAFCGCCNPSNLAVAPGGDIVTSEKHLARVKVYAPDGTLKRVVAGESEWRKGVVGLDLAVDSKGRILVLDPAADAIRIYE